MFIGLVILLVLFIIAFTLFLIWTRRMNLETFIKHCQKKIKRIAKRNDLLSVPDLSISNYDSEKMLVNHVIFGKKYIYLISDFMLKGFVSGEANDNSWVYYNNIKKTTHYLSNLHMLSDKNIRDFSGILGISSDPIVSICLIPNECDFKIKSSEDPKKIIVHYASLARKIKQFENQEIGSLDKAQIYEQYKTIENKNNAERV